MKICSKCNINKPITEFYTNGKTCTGKTKYKPTCKKCENKSIADRYYRIIKDHFGVFECTICHYNKDHRMIEYHHLNPNAKEGTLSKMKSYSQKRLKQELSKCIPLCPNCHREIHLGITTLNTGDKKCQ